MKLSDTEKRIIELYRQGARVRMYAWADTYEKVEQAIQGFKIDRIYEMDDEDIVFTTGTYSEPQISVYLKTGREVTE